MRFLFLSLMALCFCVPTAMAQDADAALEKLDWRLSVAAYSFRNFTFFETLDKVSALGVKYVEGFNFQKISDDIPVKLDPAAMTDEQIKTVKERLEAKNVKMIALYYGGFPTDEAACRRVFERSKALGVEYFVSEPKPAQLAQLDRIAAEYKMFVGLHGHSKTSSPTTWHPELVAKQCAEYSPHIGAFSDTGHWIRSELDPSEGAAVLKDRFLGVEIHDLNEFGPNGRDVPLGQGMGKMKKFLETIAKVRKGPVLISIEYNTNPQEPSADVRQCVRFIRETAGNIAAQR